jgi:hypothetical protein
VAGVIDVRAGERELTGQAALSDALAVEEPELAVEEPVEEAEPVVDEPVDEPDPVVGTEGGVDVPEPASGELVLFAEGVALGELVALADFVLLGEGSGDGLGDSLGEDMTGLASADGLGEGLLD